MTTDNTSRLPLSDDELRSLLDRLPLPDDDLPPAALTWCDRTRELLGWFDESDRDGLLPEAPFVLNDHTTVSDPAKFYATLWSVAARGPHRHREDELLLVLTRLQRVVAARQAKRAA